MYVCMYERKKDFNDIHEIDQFLTILHFFYNVRFPTMNLDQEIGHLLDLFFLKQFMKTPDF